MAGLLGVHVDNWGHPVLVLLVQLLLRLLLRVHTQKVRQLRLPIIPRWFSSARAALPSRLPMYTDLR